MVKCTRRQVRQLKSAVRWKIPPKQRQRIQMVLLRESGMTQPLIAAAMGVSLSTVNRTHMARRPEVASQLIRQYIYLYGAVSPKDGICVYLIMPKSDRACFQVFLNALSRKFARQDILLVLDGAPNHRCSGLLLPGNISLLFLPRYAPELTWGV